MQTIQKAFVAMALLAVIGLVGCGDGTKTELPPKTGTTGSDHGDHGAHEGSHSHDDGKTEPMKTEPMGAEPEKVEPIPPANDTKQPTEPEAESGSGEKKGGVEIPNE